MEDITYKIKLWEKSDTRVFWGEIAPSSHVVQFYENDNVFMNTLVGFVLTGLKADECVIIIAKDSHILELNRRIRAEGYDIYRAIAEKQFIPVNAEEMLNRFLVNGWPDEIMFNDAVTGLIAEASNCNRKIRAFGEMVAMLWEKGNHGATVQLEHLWCRLHNKGSFSLYCAYPKSGLTQNLHDSIKYICKAHSLIIDGQSRPSTEIYYGLVGMDFT